MKLRFWKRLGLAVGVFVLLVISTFLILPQVIDLNRYDALIVNEIQKAIGGKVQIGNISWGIIGNLDLCDIYVEVDGFSIEGASSFKGDAQLKSAYAEISIIPLISKRIVVETLLIESPVSAFWLVPKPTTEKSETKPEPTHSGEPDSQVPLLPLEIGIREAILKNGRIIVDDSITSPGQRIAREFSNIEIHTRNLIPGEKIDFNLSLRDPAKPGLGSLDAQGTFSGLTKSLTIENPKLDLSVSLSEIDMDAVKPYLQNPNIDQRIGGTLSMSLKYSGDLGKQFHAEGTLNLSRLLYTNPAYPEKTLPGAKTILTYQVSFNTEHLVVKQLDLSLGSFNARVKGVLKDWQTGPVIGDISLSSKIPLNELERLIPWQKLGKESDVIRRMMQKGGQIFIENAVLPDIDLANLPKDPLALLPAVKLAGSISGISGEIVSYLPDIYISEGNILLEQGALMAEDFHVVMGPITLPDLQLQVTNLLDKPKVVAQLNGTVRLGKVDAPYIKSLLNAYGLRNLAGKMDVSFQTTYDHAEPEKWKTDGAIFMENIRAESHPAVVVLENLTGRMTLSRDTDLRISVEEIEGKVGNAPIRIHGKIIKEGASRLSIDADVYAKRLDLSKFAALIPDLKKSELSGLLDVNTSVHYTSDDPAKTRLGGKLTATDFSIHLAEKNLMVSNGYADIALIGNKINVNQMDIRVNDQQIILKGQIIDPKQPKLQIHLKADALEIAPLLPVSRKLFDNFGIVKKASGTAALDLNLNLAAAKPDDFKLEGSVELKDFNLLTTLNPASINHLGVEALIKPKTISIRELSTTVVLPNGKNSSGGSFQLDFQGEVSNWRGKPALGIKRFKTSLIPMASLASAVPWEKLGAAAEKIKKSITAGGGIRVKHLSVLETDLSSFTKDPISLLSRMNAVIELNDIAVRPIPALYKIEGITGLVGVEKGVLTADDVQLRMGPVTLPDLDLRVTNLSNKPKISAQLEGSAQLGDISTPQIRALLETHGLKNLTGKLYVAFHAEYDHATPELWKADGNLIMKNIRAESISPGVIMENLNGRVSFDRKKHLNIILNEVSGRVNDAPIRISGNVLAGGQGKFDMDAAIIAENLDLSHVVALYPEIKELELAGILDMDLRLRYTSANPIETQLQGKMHTRSISVRLIKKNITIREGDANIAFAGNEVKINNMTFLMNDKRMRFEGLLANPNQPNLRLHLTAEDVDLDRLLPSSNKEEITPADASTDIPPRKRTADNQQLPIVGQNLTAYLQVDVAKGRIRGQPFQNLTFRADYAQGLLNKYALHVEFGEGTIRADGSADLRNLEEVSFAINPAITNVRLESIGEFFGNFESSLKAPLTVTGSLKGYTGSTPHVFASLSGNLETEVGRGRFTNVGPAGKALSKILSVVNIQGLISGRIVQDLSNRGLSFQYIKADASFKGSAVHIDTLRFESDPLDMIARETVDMVKQQLDLEVDLIPLRIVSGTLSRVPVVGRTAASLSYI